MALSTLVDFFRVLGLLPEIEFRRRVFGARALVDRVRARGLAAPPRSPRRRARLRRLIALADALVPPRSCYRRALMEMALDHDAAAQPLVVAFDLTPSGLRGHAWLGGEGSATRGYAVAFEL